MQKGAAPLLLLVLVLVVITGGVYFYLQGNSLNSSKSTNLPPPQPTLSIVPQDENYSNPLGFGFQYPNGLTVKEDSEEEFNQRSNGDFRKNFTGYVGYEPGKFLGGVVVLGKDQSFDTNPFTLWIFENPRGLTIDAWYKNYWYYPFVWGDFTYKGKFELAPKEESTISGQMVKTGVIDYQPGKPKFVYLSRGGKIFLFRIIGEDGDKILATFKFTTDL